MGFKRLLYLQIVSTIYYFKRRKLNNDTHRRRSNGFSNDLKLTTLLLTTYSSKRDYKIYCLTLRDRIGTSNGIEVQQYFEKSDEPCCRCRYSVFSLEIPKKNTFIDFLNHRNIFTRHYFIKKL